MGEGPHQLISKTSAQTLHACKGWKLKDRQGGKVEEKSLVRLSSVSVWLVVKLSQRLNNAMMQLRVSEYLKVTRSLMIEMSQQQKSKLCCCRSQFQEVHAEQKRSEWVQIGLSHSGRLGRRMPPWSEVMASSNYVRPWQKLMESFATRNRIRGRRQWRIDLTACEGEPRVRELSLKTKTSKVLKMKKKIKRLLGGYIRCINRRSRNSLEIQAWWKPIVGP